MRARKTSTRSKIWRAVARSGCDLDERQFARDRRRLGDVVHVDHVFKFKQAGADAVAGFCRCLADQREARQPGRSLRPTVSELMLMFRRRNSDATRVSTPGKSST